jgi:hypothetical protein
MIAPEAGPGSKLETGRGVLLRNNLLVSTLIFLLLELWRPCFFLTDDNLDGALPFFSEMGHHLLAGRSPFVSDYLFGGHYNLLRDPSYFCWNPIYLLVSLLAGTPLHLLIVDVDAYLLFMLSAAGFVNLAWHVRRELALEISDGWIMFYTLSFVYSMIALTTASSWLTFLGNSSALPWLVLGILQRSWWRGIGLVALFSLHQILGGHPEPTISSTLFLSLFAGGVSWARRSIQPLGCWAVGYGAAILFILPLLIPMLGGFFSSARSHGVDLADMQSNNIPPLLFFPSIFLGMALWLLYRPEHLYTTYTLALGSCAASWCLLTTLGGGQKWSRLEKVTLGLLILIGILICRPIWISEIMIRLPLLKSMRWPFRELVQFQFFLHFFLLVRTPGFVPRIRFLAGLGSGTLFAVPLFLYPLPPTFNAMNMDRHLLISGGFERYWSQVRPLFQPGDRVATIIPMKLYSDDRFQEPYSLLSTYNYACLTHVISTEGWSQTPPADQFYTRTPAWYPFGAYLPGQKAALLAEQPALKCITLESLKPLKITLSSRDGPTIDLTPYIPAELRGP